MHPPRTMDLLRAFSFNNFVIDFHSGINSGQVSGSISK